MEYLLRKYTNLFRTMFVLLLGLVMSSTLTAQTPITHNIATGNLVIPGTSTDNYIITGNNGATNNTVIVESGYHGTITLSNLTMNNSTNNGATGASGFSCITVEGIYDGNNLAPVTVVEFILDGNNYLKQSTTFHCAIQVNQGAQVTFNSVDPNDNTKGTLTALVYDATVNAPGSGGGAAAIGVPQYVSNGPAHQGNATLSSGSGNTAGGNIIIASGTITASGGYHGAGIGGGWYTYFAGIIVIYGGDVTSRGGGHAAGIGSGCPNGNGVIATYVPGSAIVALPPGSITATSAQSANNALAGAASTTYIGDPLKPLITVRTVENTPNADIYLDLSSTPNLQSLLSSVGITPAVYDLTKVRVGRTNAGGTMTFRAEFQQSTTFFTDASSINPANLGRPFMPVATTVIGNVNTVVPPVILPLLDMNIAFTDYPSTPLAPAYTSSQATQNAYVIKVVFSDTRGSMTDISIDLQTWTDFLTPLQFFGPDSITSIAEPTSLSNGDIFFIRIPVVQGKPIGIYNDVLRMSGTFDGAPTGTIRRVVEQRVVYDDTGTNSNIHVTANPTTFYSNNPATASTQLTLWINHGTFAADYPYDPLDVIARYLITTEPNYDAAIAAVPLNYWTNLVVPATDGGSIATTASFTGKPDDTYYIHWYVVSKVIFAHSTTVVGPPPAQYGGFGPYIIDTTAPTVSIEVDGEATAKTINDLNDLTVTITFNEPINATSFTVSDFTISPAASATIVSGSISVSATDDKVYTATLRPSTSLANGNSFTIQIPSGAVTDLAGNTSAPASNTVTVTFSNTTKPVVSFADVDPVYNNLRPSFTVVIDPNDFGINGNTDLYQTAGGSAIAVTTNLASLFTITPNGGTVLPTTAYTALYSKQVIGTTTVGVITFAFSADLQNSTQYTVAIAADNVFNKLGLGNDPGSANFTTAEPDFTQGSISANPNLFDDLGGPTELTIKGEALKLNADLSALSVRVACTALGYNSGQISTGFVNGTGADAGFDLLTISGVSIPANTTGATITYTFTLYMTFQGGAETNTGRSCDVVVEPAMSYIVKVTNTTTSVSDLTYGYNLATAQSAAYIQHITVENMGAIELNDLQVSFAGTDQAVFASASLSPTTGLAAGATATFYVYLTPGQNAGTYGTSTNVVVSAKQGTATTAINGRDALVQQKVVQKAGTGVEANLTGAPPPSGSWTNTSTIALTPSATEASTTGDAVTDWKYAVTTSTAVPVPTASDWVTVSSGSPATYNVPSGIEGTYYIHWVINTTNYSDVAGIVTDATVQTYLIDRIAPTVVDITSSRSDFTGPSPFTITVEFSEGVTLSQASQFMGVNASVSTPVGVGTPVGGLYTEFEVTVTPNAGLTDGQIIRFSVEAGAVKDKAGNDNLASATARNITLYFEGNRPTATITPSTLKTNTDFTVTIEFSKAIIGLDPATDLNVSNGAAITGFSPVSGDGTTFTFTVNTSGSVSGTPIVITLYDSVVEDAQGNKNLPASASVDYNTEPTTVTLSYGNANYVNVPFNVTVTFSRPVTGVTAGLFTNTASGDFSTPVSISGSLQNYILTFTPNAGVEGIADIQMPATTAVQDEYGNGIAASNIVTAKYDTRKPLVQSIYMVTPMAEVNFDPFDVVIVFDETDISSLDLTKLESDILAFLSVVSGPVVNGTTTEFVVRVQVPFDAAITGQTLGIKVNEGAIRDKATNPNVVSSVFGLTNWTTGGGGGGTPGPTGPPIVFVDNVAPYVVSLSPSGAWAPIKGNMIITFNKRINPNSSGRIWLQDFGYLDLSNGVWLDQRTLSMPYGYLSYYATYQINISDFRDLSNNLQDPDFWGVFVTGAPYRPNFQREIVFFAGEGIELSINPNTVHYIPIARDFTFTVKPKPGYNLDNLKVSTGNDFRDREGGVVITMNADGSATVTLVNVMESMYVTVTIGALSNETPEVNKVWAYGSNLYIQTYQPATVYIYTVTGALFRQMNVNEGALTVPLPRGIYTVLVDGKTYKVSIQ